MYTPYYKSYGSKPLAQNQSNLGDRDRPSSLNLTNVGQSGGPHKPTRYGPTTSTQLAPISSSSKSSSYTNLPGAGAPTASSTSGYSSSVYSQLTKPSGPSQGQVNTKSAQYQLGLLDRAPTNFYRPSTLTPAPAIPPQPQSQQIPISTNLSSAKSAQNLLETLPDDIFCLSCPPAEFKFSDAYRAKTLPRTGKENERLIGFATLPEQVHRKSVKKGFDFTLMAVGETGLGKSTLINSLFLGDFYQNRKIPSAAEKIKKTTTIQKHSIEIEERGVRLRLTVVDTPGFGDALNCEESWKSCVEHIDEQFNQYFQAESGLNRRHIQDTRIHCCLYFIPPYGHGLRQLDVEVLKNLQNRVNVIPIIAKADTLTPSEVRRLKDNILEDLKQYRIQIYQFPECDEEEDEDFKQQDRELKASIPFAVSSSDTFVEVAGKKVRGRIYPWGIVEVENPNHSDFSKLRTMLIQSHMHDLKETTQDLHYENFRAKAIAQISQGNNYKDRSKLKRDSSFDTSQDMLHQKEAEIKRMQQMISKMEAKLKAAGHSSGNTSRDSVIEL